MARMVRKQIYIQQQQQVTLKRLAKLRGKSEAEIIRSALDHELRGASINRQTDSQAWEQAYQFMLALHERGPLESKPRDWKREDLYEERLSRYD